MRELSTVVMASMLTYENHGDLRGICLFQTLSSHLANIFSAEGLTRSPFWGIAATASSSIFIDV